MELINYLTYNYSNSICSLCVPSKKTDAALKHDTGQFVHDRGEQKIEKKLFLRIFVFFVSFVFSVSEVTAESRYTRERSEALFHLIDWQPYSQHTFLKALRDQKPVFLLISAPAWCYWCHVYESEDYLYHPELYPFINENFIAVFVDSDKRPDLTKKYLEGGWPSTTILTPDLNRISGFSGPTDSHALRDYLERVVTYLQDKTFTKFNDAFRYEETEPVIPEKDQLIDLETSYLSYITTAFDDKYGGFILGDFRGMRQQKFPAGFLYKYLLEKYDETGDNNYLRMVEITFENQYTPRAGFKNKYRLFDPVEGGFHRYSTKRDWSIPHYEKMLGDQAKLIRAYAHLLKITNDVNVSKAVHSTISFVMNKFHDDEGGFYASQDAYLESEYYGLTKEEREQIDPPYIDRTRIMDANSMMVSTFLYLHDVFRKKEYQETARDTLDFMHNKMIGRHGAYYYYDYEKKRPYLTGQAVANAWAILAFIEGYSIIREEKYLVIARELAHYSLRNLYDWRAGGFFARNSQDADMYAPYEGIDLSKTYQDNAVYAYAMLRLYLLTEDLDYLESGMKTVGYLLTRPGRLDEMYYAIRASKIVLENNLIDAYETNGVRIKNILEKGKAGFFLRALFDKEEEVRSPVDAPQFRDDLSGTSFFVLIVLAFSAGMLSFLSPCTLPVLSAYFAQGFHARKGEILKHTVFFFLGLAMIFSVFGMGATLAGSILKENRVVVTQAAALVIIIFGVLEMFGRGFSGLNIYLKGSYKTPFGSYLFGVLFAVGWSACIGPILASLLLLSAATATVIKGTALLFIYSLGLAVPLMLVSLFFDRIKNKRFWNILQGKGTTVSLLKMQIPIHSTYVISGLILIVLGVLIFNDYLYKLNQLTFQTDYVQNLILKGEDLLQDLMLK